VAALLDHAAAVEHDDPPRAADGRKSVGDHDRGAPGQQPAQGGFDARLGVDVHVRRGLVEDQQPRVGDQGAGERDQLALARRQLRPALSHLGVIAVLQSRHELVGAHRLGRGGDLVLGGVGAPERDVVGDRAGEQEALLGHHAQLRAQRRRAHVAQVMAVDRHAPLGGVVEAPHQLGQRRLAGSRRPHQRHRLTGRHLQVHVPQRPGAVAIAERHLFECQVPLDPLQRHRAGTIHQVGLLVQQLEDLVQRRHPRLVGRVQLRKLPDRVEEVVQRGHERHQHADCHLALDRLVAAVQQDAHGGDCRQQLHRREVGGVEVHGAQVGLAVLLVELREALAVARLLTEGAHQAHA
jgi:hypothetical protein